MYFLQQCYWHFIMKRKKYNIVQLLVCVSQADVRAAFEGLRSQYLIKQKVSLIPPPPPSKLFTCTHTDSLHVHILVVYMYTDWLFTCTHTGCLHVHIWLFTCKHTDSIFCTCSVQCLASRDTRGHWSLSPLTSPQSK